MSITFRVRQRPTDPRGSASVLGTLAGAFMIAYLRNRCVVMGWPNYVQEMIVGHLIILAVAVDLWRRRRTG